MVIIKHFSPSTYADAELRMPSILWLSIVTEFVTWLDGLEVDALVLVVGRVAVIVEGWVAILVEGRGVVLGVEPS